MTFIQLNDDIGPVWVNVDRIVSLRPTADAAPAHIKFQGGATIRLDGDHRSYFVKETVEEICTLIRKRFNP